MNETNLYITVKGFAIIIFIAQMHIVRMQLYVTIIFLKLMNVKQEISLQANYVLKLARFILWIIPVWVLIAKINLFNVYCMIALI